MQVLRLAQSWSQTAKAVLGGSGLAPVLPTGKTVVPESAAPAPATAPMLQPDTFVKAPPAALTAVRSDAERIMSGLAQSRPAAVTTAATTPSFAIPGLADILKGMMPSKPVVATPVTTPIATPPVAPVPVPVAPPVVAPIAPPPPPAAPAAIPMPWESKPEAYKPLTNTPMPWSSAPGAYQPLTNIPMPWESRPAPQAEQAQAVAPSNATASGQAPYINQYHPDGEGQGYTNGGSNCGPTSAAMIARAFGYGAGMTDAKLINHLGAIGGTTSAGTSVNGIAAMARAMGKQGTVKGPSADTAWIADQLRAGKMVVANGDYYAMAPHDASKIGSGGHYVAVIGLDGNGNFLVHDPADRGIQNKSFTPDQLARFINANRNGGWQVSIG